MLDWGDFRPSYRRLSFLHPLIPHATIFALSATLTPTMVTEVKTLLGLSNVELVRLSNNRQNLSYVVKKMAYTQQSLHDLAFLVPQPFSPSCPPPKFMIFMRSKVLCERAAEFLRQRLPAALRDKIVWVHADMTRGFNERALANLRDGSIYGIVCTDVAGMVSAIATPTRSYLTRCLTQGIDIPDVELVIQYQVPSKFCMLFQRFGRGARHPLHWAFVVLIAEPKYFDREGSERQASKQQANRKRVRGPTNTAAPKRQRNNDAGIKKEEPDAEIQTLADGSADDKSAHSHPRDVQAPRSGVKAQRQKKQDIETEQVMDSFINAPLRRRAGDTSACCRVPGNQFFANPVDLKGT